MRHSSGDVHDWGVRRAVNTLSAFAFIYVAIETLAGLLGGKAVLPALFPHASQAQINGPLGDWTVAISVVLALLFALISQWPVIVGHERHGQDQVQGHCATIQPVGLDYRPGLLLPQSAGGRGSQLRTERHSVQYWPASAVRTR